MKWAKKCRLLAEMSQNDMAELLGVHVNTYIRKEKDEDLLTIGEVKKIAAVTNTAPEGVFLPETPQM